MAIEPPPRITGNTDNDVVALNGWVHGLFQSLDVLGEFAQSTALAALEADKVDPATSSAATAQETANAAKTLAESNETRLDILETQEAGSATISGTETTVEVTLATEQTDNSYFVAFGGSAISGSPPDAAHIITGITKTTTTFTIQLKTAPGASNSITLDWILMR